MIKEEQINKTYSLSFINGLGSLFDFIGIAICVKTPQQKLNYFYETQEILLIKQQAINQILEQLTNVQKKRSAILIQSSIRRFLAQKKLKTLHNKKLKQANFSLTSVLQNLNVNYFQ